MSKGPEEELWGVVGDMNINKSFIDKIYWEHWQAMEI